MFRMMTPIDAISYGLRAGMAFGHTQTLWATRMLEMQGLWMGFPALVSDIPKFSSARTEDPVVTQVHVEALAAAPPVAAVAAPVKLPVKPKPVRVKAAPRPISAPAKTRTAPKPALTPRAKAMPPAAPVVAELPPKRAPVAPPQPAVAEAPPTTAPQGLALKPVPRRNAHKAQAKQPPLAE